MSNTWPTSSGCSADRRMEKWRTTWICTPEVSDHSLHFAYVIDADGTRIFTVLQELKSELAPVNARRVLRGHSSVKKDPNELSNSKAKVNHRMAEQERRTATRHLLDQISAFFLVQGQEKVSLGELLLFGKSTDSRSETMVYLLYCLSCHLSEDR